MQKSKPSFIDLKIDRMKLRSKTLVKMTIEKTEIVKTPDYEKFFFNFYKCPKALESDKKLLFKSRATIIDRPCWRDDQVEFDLTEPLDEYLVEIVAIKKPKKG